MRGSLGLCLHRGSASFSIFLACPGRADGKHHCVQDDQRLRTCLGEVTGDARWDAEMVMLS